MEFILKNKKAFAILFWLWVGIILYFTLVPNNYKLKVDVKDQSYRIDYILHFIVYFSLAILYLLWKADRFYKVKTSNLIYFLVGGILLSGLSEYAQTLIPGRTFNPIDFYSNTFGLIVGTISPTLIINLFLKK